MAWNVVSLTPSWWKLTVEFSVDRVRRTASGAADRKRDSLTGTVSVRGQLTSSESKAYFETTDASLAARMFSIWKPMHVPQRTKFIAWFEPRVAALKMCSAVLPYVVVRDRSSSPANAQRKSGLICFKAWQTTVPGMRASLPRQRCTRMQRVCGWDWLEIAGVGWMLKEGAQVYSRQPHAAQVHSYKGGQTSSEKDPVDRREECVQ